MLFCLPAHALHASAPKFFENVSSPQIRHAPQVTDELGEESIPLGAEFDGKGSSGGTISCMESLKRDNREHAHSKTTRFRVRCRDTMNVPRVSRVVKWSRVPRVQTAPTWSLGCHRERSIHHGRIRLLQSTRSLRLHCFGNMGVQGYIMRESWSTLGIISPRNSEDYRGCGRVACRCL